MTKRTKNSNSVDIIEESRKWVTGNKGMEIHPGAGSYSSPRVSSEIPDCSMPMTFDHLNYCSLGCLYCFAYFFKSNNPAIKEITLRSVNVDKMALDLQGKSTSKTGRLFYEHFYKRKFLLHWGGLADPFCYFEQKNGTGLKLIKTLGDLNYPTLFSFKGETIFRRPYIQAFEKFADQSNFAFQVSIITGSDEKAKQIEIGVPPPSRRLSALKTLSDMGYWTILRLRPFIIGISDEGLDDLLERALVAGIKGVSMEFFAMDCRSNEGMAQRYKWIAKQIGVPNLHKHFVALSPSERGGYMRLNRLVKEPYVRKVYEFCAKHNLVCAISDPDFKELNTSGSCCGMPDHHPKNPLLENWTKSQLTYHLKQARQLYHKTGDRTVLEFGKVYGNESYLDEKGLANDHVDVIGMCCAERNSITQRMILQKKWNNLRSPANPRNYLHGKVLPHGTDSEGNLTFIYTPHEYEDRWKRDGIDLTR